MRELSVCTQDAAFVMKLIKQLDHLYQRVGFLEEICQGQMIRLLEIQEYGHSPHKESSSTVNAGSEQVGSTA